MHQGMPFNDFIAEVKRQQLAKCDLITDTRKIHLSPDMQTITYAKVNNDSDFQATINPIAHANFAEHLDIPTKYYNRLLENHPDLLANNLNTLANREPQSRMFRLMDNTDRGSTLTTRAIVSDRYKVIDNYPILTQALVPAIREYGAVAQVRAVSLSETKMHLKVINPSKTKAVAVGDVISVGLSARNSEVRRSKFELGGFVESLACTNGMVLPNWFVEGSISRSHIGGKQSEAFVRYLSDKTIELADEAFFRQVRDVAVGILHGAFLDRAVEAFQAAKDNRISQPEAAITTVVKRYQLTDDERNNVLNHLLLSADMSQYGLANAITRSAQDSEAYDRADELEALGGHIITLTPSEWRIIGEADKNTAKTVKPLNLTNESEDYDDE